jgi:hypothetical protein
VFTSIAPEIVLEAETYAYAVETRDADGESPRIEATGLPAWLTLQDHGDGTASLGGIPRGVDVGDYALTLRAIDGAGLTAEQSFILTVTAAPDIPIIEILGANPLTITQGQVFVDPGASAHDVQDGDLTAAIAVRSTVNTQLPGSYDVTYTVSDSAGHVATAIRSVIVTSRPSSRSGGGGGSLDGTTLVLWLAIVLMIAGRERTIRQRVGP